MGTNASYVTHRLWFDFKIDNNFFTLTKLQTYTLAEFDVTTHNSASRDDATIHTDKALLTLFSANTSYLEAEAENDTGFLLIYLLLYL
jgi:hypothetical protein